jgi:oxygen-independent coproporphyrinogen-3 oxidase
MKVLLIRRAGELFASHGYEAVGIDHFVKPDNPLYRASRENKVIKDFMGYSVEQRRSFIGFGSSAISYLGNTYFHNAVSQKEYYAQLDGDRLPFGNGMAHHLTRDDVIRNRIIQKSILCDSAIDKKELGGLFEIDFDDYFKKELALLKDYEKDGLVESVDGDRIAITRMGKYMARHIAFVFDRYYG